MTQILVGCDPEVFVRKGGKFMSAHGLIRGDKQHPHPVSKGAVQVDGMALEFNIDPAATEDEFCLNINTVYGILCAMVPGYEVVATPVADFTMDYLNAQPAEAKVLGCEPDFNGWSGGINPRPDGDRPMRTASGHVHIGWSKDENIADGNHLARCHSVVKQLDFFLGLPSLIYDKDTRRREMYGCAGAYRPKSYGVEYRTLSNAWLASEELMRWVYRATTEGVKRIMEGDSLIDRHGDIQRIINTSDVKAAKAIIKAEKLEVPNV